MRPKHNDSVVDWYPAVHVSVFNSDVTFSGDPLPTPMRPKYKDSVAGWYPAVHESVFSWDVTFSGASLPTPTRPKHRDSAAGWYAAVHAFSSSVQYYIFWIPPFLAFLHCHTSVLSAQHSV